MKKISDVEIYQTAAAILAKYQYNQEKATNFIINQLCKYSDPMNEEMLDITRRVENAIFELADMNVENKTVH